MIQGSQEWFQLRKTKITATDAPIIMGESPWKKAIALYQEKLDPDFHIVENENMKRGTELEPFARLSFILDTGIDVNPHIVIKEWAMASLDGISSCGKHLVEIKCLGKKGQELASKGEIHPYYKGQLQHQMWICDVPCMYYYSFDGYNGIVIEVKRDDFYIDLMIQQEKIFYDCMVNRDEKKLRELF